MNSKLYCINPNTKEYEEVKSIYGINIEEILDLIRDYKISKDLKFDKFGRLEEIDRLNNIINELDEWLKEKKEQMEEFELYKRKETGAFWYSTMGDIETFIEKIKELKGSE